MNISLKQIEIFVAIAQAGNMSVAAEKLYLSQSACSMALTKFEEQLNGPLFDRVGKRLILNERGKLIFAQAANIIEQCHELKTILTNSPKQLAGELIVGASTTIGNYFLPDVINDFTINHPQIRIKLEIGNTEQIIKRLLKFTIDIGIIEGNCISNEIKMTPWCKDNMVIITAPKHPLQKIKKLNLKDLLASKWILREPGSGTREKFEEAMGVKMVPFLELSQTEAIKRAVAAGIGISCVSVATVADAIANKQLKILPTPFLSLSRDFNIILHKNKYASHIIESFMQALGKDVTS